MMGADEFFQAEDGRAKPNGQALSQPLQLVHFADMQPRLGDGYLIKNLLGSRAMAVIYGEPGSGKTFLTLYLALSVAAGREFFGRRVRRVGVIYIAAEAGRGIENRVVAARQETALPPDLPFAAITSPVDLCTAATEIETLIDTIRNAAISRRVELIIIDTLSRVMAGGNENAPDDMGALVRNLDRLRAETGAAVVIVHHSGKDAGRGARGHSLLRAAAATEIEITKDEIGIATARATKQRDFATVGAMSFKMEPVELGLDQDGDQVTTCIVIELDDDAAPRHAKTKLLSPAQRRALQLLLTGPHGVVRLEC